MCEQRGRTGASQIKRSDAAEMVYVLLLFCCCFFEGRGRGRERGGERERGGGTRKRGPTHRYGPHCWSTSIWTSSTRSVLLGESPVNLAKLAWHTRSDGFSRQ